MHWRRSLCLAGVGIVMLAGGCHLIVGIRDAEPYPPDAGSGVGGGGSLCEPGQVEECYSGVPASTEDVGNCKGGTKTCNAGGTSYDACVGEVTPQPADDCAVIGDEDCDGSGCSDPLWSKIFGSAVEDQLGFGVASDAQGNVYVTGSFSGSLNLGGQTLISSGFADIFLARFDAAGSHVWSKQFGGGSVEVADDIAVDAAGDVVITGTFGGTVNFGGADLTAASYDGFLAKFTGMGDPLWSRGFPDPAGGQTTGCQLAVHADTGDIYVIIGFCGGGLCTTDEFALRRYPPEGGDFVWQKQFDGNGPVAGQAITVDPNGNVLVAGSLNGTVSFGGGSLTAEGTDIFVVRFNADGDHNWSRIFGDAAAQAAHGIAADDAGNVYVTGAAAGTVNFGGASLTSNGGNDAFLVKLSSGSGAHLWSQMFGDGSLQEGDAVSVDTGGNVLVSGKFAGSINLGGRALMGTGTRNIFLAKLEPAVGAHVWSKAFGVSGKNYSNDLGVTLADEVLLTGSTDGSLNFGDGVLTSAGGIDVLLAKFAP